MHYALVLLALGVLLTLHELGHLVAARMLGVRVPRFVFGFGPPLVSFRLWGTQFVVAAVPLGATAHLQGMNPHRADPEEAAGYAARGPLLRILIILAGPLANYVFALAVMFALYTSGTHVVVPLTVGTVQPGSEAARAQLLPGDRILEVAGQPLKTWSEFVEKVGVAAGAPLELAVEREGEPRTVVVRPRPDERGTGRIGVSQQYVYKAHGAAEALSHSFTHTTNVAAEGVLLLKRMLRGLEDPSAANAGALVRQESADAMASGTDALLRTLVAASVVLALLTLIPVPGLDGGRVLLLLVEAASGRRIPPRLETVAQTVGFLGIAAAVVVMATAEIRRALPARLLMDEPSAVEPQVVEPQPPTAPGAAPETATGAAAPSTPARPVSAPPAASTTSSGKPAGTASPGTATGGGSAPSATAGTPPANAGAAGTPPANAGAAGTPPATTGATGTPPATTGATGTQPATIGTTGTQPATTGTTGTTPATAGATGPTHGSATAPRASPGATASSGQAVPDATESGAAATSAPLGEAPTAAAPAARGTPSKATVPAGDSAATNAPASTTPAGTVAPAGQ